MRRLLALVLVSSVSAGCAARRLYHTPVTAAEGALAVPAIVSTAESMGLRASGQGTQAWVRLENGTDLYWSASGEAFVLRIALPSEEGPDLEVQYREAKVKADQIWELAIQARQQNNVGAAVLITPPASDQRPQTRAASSGTERTAVGARSSRATESPGRSAGTSCRSSLDCSSGQFCKDHGGGKVCMGHGSAGAPCSSSIDCGSGLFCRDGACR